MIKWLVSLVQNRSLKTRLRKLGPLLAQRYGRSNYYTSGQILTTMQILSVAQTSHFKGYAMFLDEAAYNETAKTLKIDADYHDTRSEVVDQYFGGHHEFGSQKAFIASVGNPEFPVMSGSHSDHNSGSDGD